jgi:hypothetical protein
MSTASIFDIKSSLPTGTQPPNKSTSDKLGDYFFLLLRMTFMLVIAATNFLALSIALNCNKFETPATKFAAAIYAFFFGFIYIIVNYYTYRVLTLGKICEFDEERVFPF